MTERYVGFFRGINVGRARRVAMADLREMLKGLGLTDVRTLLNSGNALFTPERKDPQDLGRSIESSLENQLEVSSRVTVLTIDELEEVMESNPILEVAKDPSRLMVGIFGEPSATGSLEPLAGRDWSPEALAVGESAVYLWCPLGVSSSPAVEAVYGQLGDSVTFRNWKTLSRLRSISRARD